MLPGIPQKLLAPHTRPASSNHSPVGAQTDLRRIAQELGGTIAGQNQVTLPGPGHSPKDRSLAVRFDPAAPDGLLVYSFCGDPWRACRDYIRAQLGLPDWRPDRRRAPREPVPCTARPLPKAEDPARARRALE